MLTCMTLFPYTVGSSDAKAWILTTSGSSLNLTANSCVPMRLGADSLGLVDRTGTRGLPTIHSNELRPRCRSSARAHCATIIMGTRVCKSADDDAVVMSAGMLTVVSDAASLTDQLLDIFVEETGNLDHLRRPQKLKNRRNHKEGCSVNWH